MNNVRLLEDIEISSAFHQDMNSDADGDYVSLKNYHRCGILISKEAGTAGDDISIKLQQATDVAGTSAKALNFNHLYAKVPATAETWTKYTFTATDDLDTVSVGGTDLLADDQSALFYVDIRAQDLDVDNGFDCLHVFIEGDDLSNSCEGCGEYILYQARQSGATPLTAITD